LNERNLVSPIASTIQWKATRALENFAHVLVRTGNPETGIKNYQKAIMLDPLHMSTGGIGHAYFTMGNYQQAVKYIEKALKDYPDTYGVRSVLAASYTFLGDDVKARKAFEKFWT